MSEQSRSEHDANETLAQPARAHLSRRRLLTRSAIAGAAIVPAGVLAAQGISAATARPVARGLKQVWTNTTVNASQAGLVANVSMGFMNIQADENYHVTFLKTALGSNARPKPTFTGLNASSESQFAQMSMTFENLGVGAYILGAGGLSNKTYLTAAAGILAVEGRHAGFVDNILGSPLSPASSGISGSNGAIDAPFTQANIVSAVSPFIASLNGGPNPSGTLSSDTDILNFALLLEYLEAEFYNINVPQFFGTVGQG